MDTPVGPVPADSSRPLVQHLDPQDPRLEGVDGDNGDEQQEGDLGDPDDPGPPPAPSFQSDGKPYVIPFEEFGDSPPGYQQITVTYYAGDGVLADDQDQPIRDISRTVGPLNPLSFGGVSKDPHIRYVRNQRLEIDFEIILNARSYAEAVLNYGNPHRGNS
jgi:hypothetical protein